MGLNQDIAALALAPIVREIVKYDPGFVAVLMARLTDPAGELRRVLGEINLRAWRAWEMILLGPDLLTRANASSSIRKEDTAAIQLLTAMVEASSTANLPVPRARGACLGPLANALDSGRLSDHLDVGTLGQSLTALASLDSAAFRLEEEKLVASLMRNMIEAGLFDLVELHTSIGHSEPFVVITAARMFLRLMVGRNPRLLWGQEELTREARARHLSRALFAIDELQLRYGVQLDQWLQPLESDFRAFASLLEMSESELSLELEAEMDAPDLLAPGAPPPPMSAPAAAAPDTEGVLYESSESMEESSGISLEDSEEFEEEPISRSRLEQVDFDDDASEFASPGRADEEEEAASVVAAAKPSAVKKDVQRRASVRWYRRMNPQRMYPLTVALAKGRIKEVKVKGVRQAVSKEMLVVSVDNPYITIRPVLPGVLVYPPEQVVDATPDLVTVRFQVLPQMLGAVPDARIEFYWRQRLISTIELPMKVSKQTMAVIVSLIGLGWPFLGSALKSVGVEDEPKDIVRRYLFEFLRWPYAIEAGLAFLSLLAVFFWWLNRPKESSEEKDVLGVKPMSLDELLAEGRRCLLQEHWDEARSYFEDAVNVSPDHAEAKAGLENARSRRPIPAEVK